MPSPWNEANRSMPLSNGRLALKLKCGRRSSSFAASSSVSPGLRHPERPSRRRRHMATREASCSFCLKDYREVGPLVEGPDGVYICGDCSDLCQSIIGQERRRRWGPADEVLPSAAALRGRLDDCIQGQEAAKEALVAAVLAHYS